MFALGTVFSTSASSPMAMLNTTTGTSGNRLLASLPRREYQRLLPSFDMVELPFRQSIYEPGSTFRYVHFPESGLISAVALLDNGASIEVGTIGSEGMSGLPVICNGTSPHRYFVQIEGRALRMNATRLQEEIHDDTPLRQMLFRYQNAFLTQVMQSVACNGLHNVQERCARWLLRCLDKAETADVVVTHEFLAQMLGVRRASISDVLQPFQQNGLIRSRRGVVSVLDRKGLENETCECYRVIRMEFEKLNGAPAHSAP